MLKGSGNAIVPRLAQTDRPFGALPAPGPDFHVGLIFERYSVKMKRCAAAIRTMDHLNVLVRQLDALIGTRNPWIVPFGNLAQEDARYRLG